MLLGAFGILYFTGLWVVMSGWVGDLIYEVRNTRIERLSRALERLNE